MAREVTKGKILLTIDKKVLADMEKICQSIGMNKSAFVENLIKESLHITTQLFSSSETLADAVVVLSTQIQEVKKLMQDSNYFEKNKKLNEAKNELLRHDCQRAE